MLGSRVHWIRIVSITVIALFLLGHVQAAEMVVYREDQRVLLDGVKEVSILPDTVPGPLCVLGEKAFPVLLGRSDGGLQPVVAAGLWGLGRVVAFGHDGAFFGKEALTGGDTGRFILNCLRWAGKNATPLNVAVYRMPTLASWLKDSDEARRAQIRVMDWNQLNPAFLAQTHVLIVDSHHLSPSTNSLVGEFVRGGGGILVGGLGWGWLQLNPGKSLKRDFPGNLLLGEIGIFWADGYLYRTTREGFAVAAMPGREHHALEAARLLVLDGKGGDALPDSVIEQAAQTVTLAITIIPSDHPVRRLISSRKGSRSTVIPTPQSPVRRSDRIARAMLQLQVREALESETAVTAHPAANFFPGPVSPTARTVRKEIVVDPSIPGWQSTGLYAVAGRPITVEFSFPEVVGEVFVQIGCHTDQLWHLEEWKRVPQLVKLITVRAPRVSLASPFGGLIYVGMSRPQPQLAGITCHINGAVEAPVYFHGQTDLKDWARIRRLPVPWAELVSPRIILTLPAEYVRTLDNPAEVMEFWTDVIAACDRLAGGPARPDAQRIVCDLQISAGYMHSGYPIMTHLDIAPVLVDVARLQANGHGGVWGLFHEIGHNYQSPDWTFQGTGEVTNNLFTVYVFDHLCRVLREKTHPALATQERLKRRQKYFASGAPFDQWQADPFLALDMYLQLQEAFGWEPFEKTFAEYRTLKPEERPRTDSEKRDQWLIRFSHAVGRDLSGFFRRWGVPISPGAADSLGDLPSWQPAE
ncbi:MAG: M60 family metallopeptidase [Thermogutta sp.]